MYGFLCWDVWLCGCFFCGGVVLFEEGIGFVEYCGICLDWEEDYRVEYYDGSIFCCDGEFGFEFWFVELCGGEKWCDGVFGGVGGGLWDYLWEGVLWWWFLDGVYEDFLGVYWGLWGVGRVCGCFVCWGGVL